MNDKNEFIKGTAILAAANVIAKIFGAIFKIPLTYILREEGMAVFNTASLIYSTFLTFVISGVPLAASRMISEDVALQKKIDAEKTLKAASLVLMILGASASLILFFAAKPLAYAMKDPSGIKAIKVIAPSIFFVALGNAFKSYFQGTQKTLPIAWAQVGESVIRFLFGYFLARIFARENPGITAAAAIAGVTAGEIFATFFLMMSRKSIPLKETGKLKYREIYKEMAAVAVPLTVCAVVMSALGTLDVAVVRNQLLKIDFTSESAQKFLLQYSSFTDLFDNLTSELKLSDGGARWLWGAYSGYALTVFHLPLGMIATLSVSVLPIVAGNLAKKNMGAVKNCCEYAAEITLFAAVPFTVLFFFASGDVLKILFNNSASERMLALISPCVIFIGMSQLFTSIFNAAGKIYEPFAIQIFGMFLKLLGNFILIRNPYLNICGAIISSVFSYMFVCVAQYRFLKKMFAVKFSLKMFMPPFLGGAAMGLVLKTVSLPMTILFSNRMISFAVSVFLSGLAYLLGYSLFFDKKYNNLGMFCK